MTTLADAVLKDTYAKRTVVSAMTNRPLLEIRNAVVSAKRFVLDESMSSFMADLSTAVYRTTDKKATLDSMRHSALLPHPVTWVEFNGRAFRKRIIELNMSSDISGGMLASPEEVSPTWGMLLEQHPKISTAVRLTEFLNGDPIDPGPFAMPFSHCWNAADEPLPWKTCHKSGMLGHGVIGYETPYIGTIMSPAANKVGAQWTKTIKLDDGELFDTHHMVLETAGVTRYALAFLAALNDMPVMRTSVTTSQKYYMRGSFRKFLDHTILRLDLPAKANVTHVARRLIAAVHRRAHDVRGHWRRYERASDATCEHHWTAIDEENRSRCTACPSWRTWIPAHQRGDASIGLVGHDYAVTHTGADR